VHGNGVVAFFLFEGIRRYGGNVIPMPSSKLSSFNQKYWSGKTTGMHRHSTEDWFERQASELDAMLPDGGILLDVGCGACELTTYLGTKFDQIYGIDCSETMLATARDRITGLSLKNVKLFSGTAQKFPGEMPTPNVIMSYAVVQSLSHEDLENHLQECSRVLAPGGAVCIAFVPDAGRKNFYYYGYFTDGRYRRLRLLRSWLYLTRLRAKAFLQDNFMWDGVGSWFSKRDIELAAGKAGFDVEFRSAWFSEYRFHALLRRRPSPDPSSQGTLSR
jgi:cyclopropane-fatty-acyl-phospholipid synthase